MLPIGKYVIKYDTVTSYIGATIEEQSEVYKASDK